MPRKEKEPKNAFAVYHLNDGEEWLTKLDAKGFQEIELKLGYQDFRLFIQHPQQYRTPKWQKLLLEAAKDGKKLKDLRNQTASFVTIVDTGKHKYAFCGGLGSFVIQEFADDQFGLEIACRIIPSNRILNIRSKHLAGRTQQEEFTYRGYFNYATDSFDWEKLTGELIGDVKSSGLEESLGLSIDSKNPIRLQAKAASFSVKRALTWAELRSLTKALDKAITKKPLFPLVKGYREVTKRQIKEELQAKLVEELAGQYTEYCKSPDTFTETTIGISLNDPKQLLLCCDFEVVSGKKSETFKDFDLWTLFQSLQELPLDEIKEGHLRNVHVSGTDDDGSLQFTELLRSVLYAEIPLDGKGYALINGKWFEITKEFVKAVNDQVAEIFKESEEFVSSYMLPEWDLKDDKLETEPDYIGKACKEAGLVQLHGAHVDANGQDKGEICDILDCRKSPPVLVFVKRGIKSQLRELFAQVNSSATALIRMRGFQQKASEKVKESAKIAFSASDFKNCKLVAACVDYSSTKAGGNATNRLSTASKLELIKTHEWVKGDLGFAAFCFYVIKRRAKKEVAK